ncbi:MAG: serine/threonine protein kinase, partial [Myxococcales bacterium]|nr:serine/threonine protein kinase [Myxococcales bacterium]
MPTISTPQLDHALEHAAVELHERALVARAAAEARLFGSAVPAEAAPVIAERYRLVEPLGRGGQGEVWRARDEQLERDVALKRLRLHPGMSLAMLSDARVEARALGRLQHPHVVAVFDVGLDHGGGEAEGLAGEAAYIVMELVPGVSMRQWQADQRRSVAEILRVARQVAAGLQAAHAIGLVHRDVKPDNILVGDDARVRVADFGLAAMGAEALPSVGGTWGEVSGESLQDVSMNTWEAGRRGAVGTAAYMAPEQLAGEPIDARADQFALAVTLFEAIHGVRPHEGATAMALLQAKEQGPPPRPAGSPLSRAAYRALARALRPRPEARFEGVADFAEALARGQRRRLHVAWAGVVGGVAVAGMAGVVTTGASGPAPCTGSRDRVAQVWDADRTQQVQRALEATGAGFARSTSARVVEGLDRYTSAWAETRDEACQVSQRDAQGPTPALDRTLGCYDQALGEVAVLVEMLGQADQAMARRAVAAVASLPDLEPCRALGSDTSLESDSSDPRLAARVATVSRALERARVLGRAGRAREELAAATEAVTEAEALGDPSLLVRALARRGASERRGGAFDEARQTLEQAYALAVEQSMSAEAAEAAGELVWLVGVAEQQPDAGRDWWRHAQARAE